MDTGQKTESISQLVEDIVKDRVALPQVPVESMAQSQRVAHHALPKNYGPGKSGA
jgi:hypothetical protein